MHVCLVPEADIDNRMRRPNPVSKKLPPARQADQSTASVVARTMPNFSRLSRVAAIDPSTSMPLQASSTTTTAKPSRCASSAE
jgi:hypothetical protein